MEQGTAAQSPLRSVCRSGRENAGLKGEEGKQSFRKTYTLFSFLNKVNCSILIDFLTMSCADVPRAALRAGLRDDTAGLCGLESEETCAA